MGRKPPAARSKQKPHLVGFDKIIFASPESVNPTVEGVETLLEGTNPSLGPAELQPEKANKKLERVEQEPKTQVNSGNLSLKRKGKYTSGTAIRRSARLQDVLPVHNQEIERLIEEVALSDSDKEDEVPANGETETNQSDSAMADTNLGERIDYLVRLLKEQQKTVEALGLMAAKRSFSSEIPCSSQARYKSLYVKSQKKVEALADENRQLTMKLEVAVAKLEAFEKGTMAFSDIVDKLKDMILVANLTQSTQKAAKARASSAKTRKLKQVKKK